MNGGDIIDVARDVRHEAHERLVTAYKNDKETVLITFTVMELDSVTQYLAQAVDIDRQEAIRRLRQVLRDVIVPHQVYPISGREYPWERHYFFEEERSDSTMFRYYAVLKKPGLTDALIKGAVEKIWGIMRSADVDTLEIVRFPPMTMCTLYVPAAADILQQHVRKKVNRALAPLHVLAGRTAVKNPADFECIRVG